MNRENIEEDNINLSSLQGRVFTRIQDDILNGKYSSGENLIETKICEELGVSRTPVREAIKQLELEGLVQSIPNKGAIVKGISAKDIEDIYKIRIILEGLAARWATEKITNRELEELEETIQLEELYTQKNDSERLMQLDSKFHDIIYKATKSKTLMHTLSNFHNYVRHVRNLSLGSPSRAKQTFKEHRAIYEAILKKNAEKAEKLLTDHVKNASSNMLNKHIISEENIQE